MPVWYPGAKCRIQVRFDNLSSDPPVPSTPGVDGPEVFGLAQPHDIPIGAFKSVGFDIVPYSATVERNSYRLADTARVSIPAQKLPFDPRTIRAATVQVFGGTYSPKEYAEAMTNVEDGLLIPDVVPVESGRPSAGVSNELFRGFCDEWIVEHSGHDTVELVCRDMTGFFLDAEAPPNALKDIQVDLPLEKVIELIVLGDGNPDSNTSRRFGLPGARGIRIVNEAGEPTAIGLAALAAGQPADRPGDREPLPTLAEIHPPQWADSKRSTKKGRKRSPKAGVSKMSMWDVITDLCVAAGFIVFIRQGRKPVLRGAGLVSPPPELVIATPRTYYGESATTGERFTMLSKIRKMIYGINLSELSIQKNITGVKRPDVIEIRVWDEIKGEQIVERFPPLIKPKNRASPSGVGDREEVKVFVMDEIGGPKARETAQAIARSFYEQLGRGDIKVRARTKHMSGLIENLADGIEADLFRLLPGDPVSVVVDQADVERGLVSDATLRSVLSPRALTDATARGAISKQIARAAAESLNNVMLQTEFRTQRVTCSFEHDSGWEFDVETLNYLDARDAVQTIDGTRPDPRGFEGPGAVPLGG